MFFSKKNWYYKLKKILLLYHQDFQSCMFTFFLSEKIQMIRWLEEILLPVHFHKFCAASTGVALLDCMFKHTHTHTFIVKSRARSSRCYGLVFVVKGPLKYLLLSYTVATQVQIHFRSAKIFSRAFFGAGPSPTQVAVYFLLRCNKHKKHFLLQFFSLMFFFTVTTCEF